MDSKERKDSYPIWSGLIKYAPAALAGVAKISKKGNDKHNPGQKIHHARGKSMDHSDCIIRHGMDLEDLLAYSRRGGDVPPDRILEEVSQMSWRVLMWSQELHEEFGGAPLAPAAVLP